MMRKLIIQRTAEAFQPDLFIVDKEPLGLKGELIPTLQMLNGTAAKTVLGLRDVMDSPRQLEAEWSPKNMLEKIATYYDRVWVYGPEALLESAGRAGSAAGARRAAALCRLARARTARRPRISDMHFLPENYILVTAGGGGDGIAMMEQVLAAREHDWQNDYPIVLVLGPFMKSESRERIRLRASRLANVNVIDFEARLEVLLANAVGVVGMCGYNTFCEVLSFDRKALFVPRTHPRQEQYIRASRARELGLCEMLTPEEASIPDVMARALRRLPEMAQPSSSLEKDDLSGLDVICDDIEQLVSGTRIPANRRNHEGIRVATVER